MDRDIKFGFWNYVESGVYSVDAVDQWKEMHSNLPMSFSFDSQRHDKRDMLAILDRCAELGLKLIIRDTRTEFRTLQRFGLKAFKNGVIEAYNDFGRHPATFGFFVGDEPGVDEYDDYIQTVKTVLEVAPERTPFANLVPYWGGGSDYDTLVGAPEKKHTAIVERFLSESKIPLLGYDQYSQCLNDGLNKECGINSYFFVLDKYNEITQKHKIPFYATLLGCGHWDYRAPTEDDIRWQIYTAIAHGARGILWFHLYQYGAGTSYVQLPIIGPDRMTTPTFDFIKRQQYIFDCYYRENLDRIYMTNVYHVGHIYNPDKRFCEDEYIKNVNGKYSLPIILSYYKEYDGEERWISLVNGDQRRANQITLTMQNGSKKSYWLAPGEMHLERLSDLLKQL